jgi:hypothetical protein
VGESVAQEDGGGGEGSERALDIACPDGSAPLPPPVAEASHRRGPRAGDVGDNRVERRVGRPARRSHCFLGREGVSPPCHLGSGSRWIAIRFWARLSSQIA